MDTFPYKDTETTEERVQKNIPQEEVQVIQEIILTHVNSRPLSMDDNACSVMILRWQLRDLETIQKKYYTKASNSFKGNGRNRHKIHDKAMEGRDK